MKKEIKILEQIVFFDDINSDVRNKLEAVIALLKKQGEHK